MNKESNKYILIYASVMVILVAVGLAFTSEVLKDKQKRNENIDKMRQILRAINIDATDKTAEKQYDTYIVETFVIDMQGDKLELDAFSIKLQDELRKKEIKRQYPVYKASINNKTYYVMALYGAGLWGPIWGYISVKEDKNSVYGADFSHQGETPGLGAEITTLKFREQFKGKELFKQNTLESIAIVKPGKSVSGKDYVDGISGGTITSNAVDKMLINCLKGYESFLRKN